MCMFAFMSVLVANDTEYIHELRGHKVVTVIDKIDKYILNPSNVGNTYGHLVN